MLEFSLNFVTHGKLINFLFSFFLFVFFSAVRVDPGVETGAGECDMRKLCLNCILTENVTEFILPLPSCASVIENSSRENPGNQRIRFEVV